MLPGAARSSGQAHAGNGSDGDAGLMHVGARYYDAQVGRFITRDTVLTQKPYLYCEHDPVNAVDPTGHGPLIGALIAGAVGGGAVLLWDWLEDGRLNHPWWHYAVGIGLGGLVGIGVGVSAGGVVFGSLVVKIGLHGAHHFFPNIGARLPHVQIIEYIEGVKGSDRIWRIPLPGWWPWK